jgi:hypothetical protein
MYKPINLLILLLLASYWYYGAKYQSIEVAFKYMEET